MCPEQLGALRRFVEKRAASIAVDPDERENPLIVAQAGQHADFWAEHHTRHERVLSTFRRAEDVMLAALQVLIDDQSFHADKGTLTQVQRAIREPLEALKVALSKRQRESAQRPRPKKHPTHRDVAIASMVQARRDDPSTERKLFIAATAAGSVCGLRITPSPAPREGYEVDCDEVADVAKHVSESALEDWWKAAGRKLAG